MNILECKAKKKLFSLMKNLSPLFKDLEEILVLKLFKIKVLVLVIKVLVLVIMVLVRIFSNPKRIFSTSMVKLEA